MMSNKSWWPLCRMHFLERPACCKYMPWASCAIKWARVHDTMFLKIHLPHLPAPRGLGASNANSPGDWGRAEGSFNNVTSNMGALDHPFLNERPELWTFLMQRQRKADELPDPQIEIQDIQNKNQDYIEYCEITFGHFSNKIMAYLL